MPEFDPVAFEAAEAEIDFWQEEKDTKRRAYYRAINQI